jgi:hypothetical protein
MSELKPCPFCGSKDIGGGSGIVNCYNCGTETRKFTGTDIAVLFWNDRSDSEDTKELVELRKANAGLEKSVTTSTSVMISLQEDNLKLEKERDDYKAGNIEAKEFIQSHIRDPLTGHIYPRKAYCPMTELAIRDLEQQSKALNEYAYSGKPLTKRGLNIESIALSSQARALKESK